MIGPLSTAARRSILQPAQLPTAKAEIGQGVVQIEVPFVAAAPGLHRHHAGTEAAVLRQKGRAEHVHHLDAVHRHAGAESAGGRVGDIGLVHQQGAALFARTVDLQAPIGHAHNARQQRQRVVHRRRARGQIFDVRRFHRRR